MKVHWAFRNCDETMKSSIQRVSEKKLHRLQRLLTRYRDDLCDLSMTIHRTPRQAGSSRFEVRTVLHLPTGTLVAEKIDDSWGEALDKGIDNLVGQLRRHKEQIRGDWVYRRKSRQREELSAAGPLLARDREASRRESFYQLLAPMMRTIKSHARRELRIMELEGTLRPGEVSVEDVVDEVLLQAWRRFEDRPADRSLDVWLAGILHDVLHSLGKEPLKASLEEPILWPEPPKDADEEYWESELTTLADVLPEKGHSEDWERLGLEEQREYVERILARMEPLRREAFLQYVLEGFDPAEIAMIQDRQEKDVLQDIEAAREALRHAVASTEETVVKS